MACILIQWPAWVKWKVGNHMLATKIKVLLVLKTHWVGPHPSKGLWWSGQVFVRTATGPGRALVKRPWTWSYRGSQGSCAHICASSGLPTRRKPLWPEQQVVSKPGSLQAAACPGADAACCGKHQGVRLEATANSGVQLTVSWIHSVCPAGNKGLGGDGQADGLIVGD